MNTKFYSLRNSGGQIVYCVTLMICMLVSSYDGIGQGSYSITRDNLFRQFSFGVGNHNYVVNTAINGVPKTTNTILNTSASGICGVLDGFIILNNTGTVADNTLRLRPTSPNTYADYVNGCTAADLFRIQQHILGIVPFTDGYQKVSADANNDNLITAADNTMIQNLILGTVSTLTRNSWEWFHLQAVTPFPTGFFNNPYAFTLKATYLSVGGFGEWRVNNVSRNWLLANMPDFTTTKIGDVVSGGSGAGHNTWVCASVPYLNNEDIATSRSESKGSQPINQGDVIIAEIYLGNGADVIAAELPIFIDNAKFTIESVELMNGFKPKYHYNAENNLLTFLYMKEDLKPLDISNTEVVKIKLIAKQSIENLSKHLKWDDFRKVELLDIDILPSNAYLELRVIDVITTSLEIYTNTQNANIMVSIISDTNIQDAVITLSNLQGQTITSKSLNLEVGTNTLTFPDGISNGLYIASLKTKSKIISSKFVVNQ